MAWSTSRWTAATTTAQAKAATNSLTRSLARELVPDERVNAVLPGPVDAPMWQDVGASAEEQPGTLRADLLTGTPYGPVREDDGVARLLDPDFAGWIIGAATRGAWPHDFIRLAAVSRPDSDRAADHELGTETMSHPPIATAIPSSSLHAIFRAADARALATGLPVTRLHVGEPYFTSPPEVAEAIAEAQRAGRTTYTDVEGLPDLRRALTAKLKRENGIDASISRIFVTPGSCQGLQALLLSLAEPGTEILLPELHWPIHVQQSLLAGLRPVFYSLDDRYFPDLESIAERSGPNSRILLVNSPANPTGAVLDADRIEGLLTLARDRGWHVISDEAYEHFVYEGDHLSLAASERQLPVEKRIVHSVFTFSKSLAMTGYRLGYVVPATDEAAAGMRVVQEAGIIAPPTPVQYGGIAALQMPDAAQSNRKLVQQNRDTVLPALRDAGLIRELPSGGWYAMVDISSTGLGAEAFSAQLLAERSVAVVPGSGFGLRPQLDDRGALVAMDTDPHADNLVRIAFCVDPEVLKSGVDALLAFVGERKAR
jgi:aspartate aminotransferase